MNRNKLFSILAALGLLASLFTSSPTRSYADDSRTFSETGKTVSGRFLTYWNAHGGLAQQGYPISDELQEKSDTDGKTYIMQYFERAVFEYHPENAGTSSEVLLSLLGVLFYNQKHEGNASGQKASATNLRSFPETGKTLGGVFRKYWETHGGLAQQGYPISDEFEERNETDGKIYLVQYFQRAVFEYHPENAGTPSEVLLSLLGVFTYNQKHPNGSGNHLPTTTNAFAVPGWTSIAATTNNKVIFYNAATGYALIAELGADGTLTTLRQYPDPDPTRGIKSPLNAGWSHVITLPNDRLLFYNTTTGTAYISKVTADGTLAQQGPYDYGKGYSHIAFDVYSGNGIFYSETSEVMAVVLLPSNANTLVQLKYYPHPNPLPTDTRWSQFVPLGGNHWFWYVSANGNGLTTKINADGTFENLKSYTTFDRDWTHIIPAGHEAAFYKMALYKKSRGVLSTAFVVGGAGNYLLKQTYTKLSPDWSIITGSQNGVILFYDAKGNIATDHITIEGADTALQRYAPTDTSIPTN